MGGKYEVVVIGAGPGGYVAAIRAAQLGFKTALIEKRETLGGTCLNVGCIPSKALLESSHIYEMTKKALSQHGIESSKPKLNFDTMMERKNKVVHELVNGVGGLIKKNGIHWIKGVASLDSPTEIRVKDPDSDTRITAEHIILATGSSSATLPFLPLNETNIVTSTGALSLKKIPEKLIVIGAGVIGVEMGSIYSRLGSQVTILEVLDHICPGIDRTIGKQFFQILKKQGLAFHLSTKVTAASIHDDNITLSIENKERQSELSGDVVLVSVGRKPYTENLGLQNVGIETTPRGFIPVDRNFRTKVPNIYAIGDIIEGPMLAHKASDEGVAVAEIIAGLNPHVRYIAIPNVIYTHPEVACVGLTDEETDLLKIETTEGICPLRANPRARCMADDQGVVKVIGRKSDDLCLGIHILGPHASEMIATGVMILEKRMTLPEIAAASFAHPTLSEAIKEATLAALNRTINI
ncbi:MAG: dihydrolipoyl dehydrogenase [Chlamydiales bacterium]